MNGFDPKERNQTYAFQVYTTEKEAQLYWRRRVRRAQSMVQRVGILSVDYENNSDEDNGHYIDNDNYDKDNCDYHCGGSSDKDDDDSVGDKGGDDKSSYWDMEHFRYIKYESLFQSMMTEKEIEQQENELQSQQVQMQE